MHRRTVTFAPLPAGRSAAAGSLLLWTHRLKQIKFYDDYYSNADGTSRTRRHNGQQPSPVQPQPAVMVGAGVQFSELYPAANNRPVKHPWIKPCSVRMWRSRSTCCVWWKPPLCKHATCIFSLAFSLSFPLFRSCPPPLSLLSPLSLLLFLSLSLALSLGRSFVIYFMVTFAWILVVDRCASKDFTRTHRTRIGKAL